MAERGQRTSSSRSRRGIAAVAVFLFGLTAPVAAADIPSTPNGSDWVTDGPIYSVAHVLGRTFIGGDFSFIGPRSGLGAPIGTDGHPAAPFPEVSGPTSADGSPPEVDAVAPDGSGGWYIGGSFSFAGGSAHANLAHISPSGAVDDSFNANTNGTVRAIAVATAGKTDAGNVYVGGDFTSINGLTRQHAAAVDATTGAPNSTWKPDPDGSVYALAESYASLGEGTPAGTRKDEPLVFLGGPMASLDKVSGAGGSQLGVHGLAAIWGVGSKAPDGATSLSGLGVTGWTPNVDSGTVRTLAASSA